METETETETETQRYRLVNVRYTITTVLPCVVKCPAPMQTNVKYRKDWTIKEKGPKKRREEGNERKNAKLCTACLGLERHSKEWGCGTNG